MNFSSKKGDLELKKIVVFLILLLVIVVSIFFISNSSKSMIGNIKLVSLEAEKKSCEIGFCDVLNCEPERDYECTEKEKSKWESMKVYLENCENDDSKCDALSNAIKEAKNNKNSNLGSGNNDLISDSKITEFTKSNFYNNYHVKFEEFAKKHNFDVKILYSIIINEDGYSRSFENSVRFECHRFNRDKGVLTRKMPCTFKNGEVFSRVYSETNYNAYLLAKGKDEKIAFKSTSFGFSQIIGENYINLGLDIDYDTGLNKLKDTSLQIDYFFKFIEKNNLIPYFKQKNWNDIARKYNGPKYTQNNYNNKLENNFNSIIV